MAYLLADEQKPMSGVDVYVVTESGVKGIAKYWDVTGQWLTQDDRFKVDDIVKKWRYANATAKD